VTRLIRGE